MKTIRTELKLTPKVRQALDKLAAEQGRTPNNLAAFIVEKYLRELGK